MGPSSSSRPSISRFPGCDISSPIVSTTAPNWRDALAKCADWTIEIVKRTAAGFQLLPRRWVVERTLAWLNRNRRLAKISRPQSPAPKPGFTSPPRSCSSGDWPAHNTTFAIKIRTLRLKGKFLSVIPENCMPAIPQGMSTQTFEYLLKFTIAHEGDTPFMYNNWPLKNSERIMLGGFT